MYHRLRIRLIWAEIIIIFKDDEIDDWVWAWGLRKEWYSRYC